VHSENSSVDFGRKPFLPLGFERGDAVVGVLLRRPNERRRCIPRLFQLGSEHGNRLGGTTLTHSSTGPCIGKRTQRIGEPLTRRLGGPRIGIGHGLLFAHHPGRFERLERSAVVGTLLAVPRLVALHPQQIALGRQGIAFAAQCRDPCTLLVALGEQCIALAGESIALGAQQACMLHGIGGAPVGSGEESIAGGVALGIGTAGSMGGGVGGGDVGSERGGTTGGGVGARSGRSECGVVVACGSSGFLERECVCVCVCVCVRRA
jgi:hypothetical protein